MIDIHAPFRERAEWVLAQVFCGLHNIKRRNIKFENLDNPFAYCEYSTGQELSTYDSNKLTVLVVSAHEACVRAAVTYSGPRMVKIQMWPRDGREGSFSKRHPTIEQAIETMRARE